MSVNLEIGERSVEVAPFKLAQLRKAAPFIDNMNERLDRVTKLQAAGEQPSLSEMAELMRALIEVLAIGTVKADPELTADAIEEAVDITFMPSLQEAVMAVLRASGLAPKGEAKAPSPPQVEGAEASELSSVE
jgi:hypothetical protein